MNVFEEARSILEKEGYQTLPSSQDINTFYFEDHVLLGFVSVHKNIETIIADWEKEQDFFLRTNASRLRPAVQKAWNAYSVFLTADKCLQEKRPALVRIEEDFRGSRKIARSDLTNPTEVARALLPLLRVQKRMTLGTEDLRGRLQQRLGLQDDQISILLEQPSVEDIVNLLQNIH
jgi:hypothetical protein